MAFQSIHIVCHHSYGFSNCQPDDNIGLNHQIAKPSVSKKVNHCLICEYQFSLNNSPENSVFNVYIPIIKGILLESILVQPHQKLFETKSPRAPPLQTLI